MSTPSPLCNVNNAAPPQSVTGGASFEIELANPTGALFWGITGIGCDETTNLATVNASGSINQGTKKATFTAPSTLGSCVIFQSTVGIGGNSSQGAGRDVDNNLVKAFTTTFKVDVLTSLGLSVIALNETFEENTASGWIAELNAAIRAISGNIPLTPGFLRLTAGTAVNTPTVTSSAPNQSGLVALADTTSAWSNPFRLPTGSNAPDAFEITLVDSKNKWSTNALTVTTDTGSVPIVDPAQIGGAGGTATSLTLSQGRASVRFKYAKTEGLYVVV